MPPIHYQQTLTDAEREAYHTSFLDGFSSSLLCYTRFFRDDMRRNKTNLKDTASRGKAEMQGDCVESIRISSNCIVVEAIRSVTKPLCVRTPAS